jgi:hypothetical protein
MPDFVLIYRFVPLLLEEQKPEKHPPWNQTRPIHAPTTKPTKNLRKNKVQGRMGTDRNAAPTGFRFI